MPTRLGTQSNRSWAVLFRECKTVNSVFKTLERLLSRHVATLEAALCYLNFIFGNTI
jgi:hypothetical protein